jgi:hypothetical protein
MLAFKKNAIHQDGYVYVDNGADVLVVAHADVSPSIEKFPFFAKAAIDTKTFKDTRLYSPYLDDRLGIWLIFEQLPKLGIVVDVLITTGEEIGMSTAIDFALAIEKEYNWIAEFDRRGQDVVMYEYESKSMEKALKSSGFKLGIGTFSDICELEVFGVACFNVGIGYHREHSTECWASMNELENQLKRFSKFFHGNKDQIFVNEAPIRQDVWGDNYFRDEDELYSNDYNLSDKLWFENQKLNKQYELLQVGLF